MKAKINSLIFLILITISLITVIYQSNNDVIEYTGLITWPPVGPFYSCDYTCTDASCVTGNLTSPGTVCLGSNIIGNVTVGSDDVILECKGYAIDGNRLNVGVRVENKDNVTITNCYIHNQTENILFYNVNNSNVINNDLYADNRRDSGDTTKGLFMNFSNYNTIVNNSVHHIAFGIYLDKSSSNNQFTGNSLAEIGNGCFYLQSTDRSNRNNLFNNNTMNSCAFHWAGVGFQDMGSMNSTYEYNNITRSWYGMSLAGNDTKVINNRLYNNLRGGIDWFVSATPAYSFIIANNTIYNNTVAGNGIHFNYGLYDSIVSDNNITNDVLMSEGISLENTVHNNTIQNNTISKFSTGIRIASSSSFDNDIFENRIYNTTIGILFNDADFNTVYENDVYNNQYGIRLIGAISNIFYNNNISYNTADGIEISDVTVINNTFYNNWISGNIKNIYAPYTGVNFWNTTLVLGTNIIGGSYIGGNYWSDYLGYDKEGDGVSNYPLPYTGRGNISYGGDYLPLTNNYYPYFPQVNMITENETLFNGTIPTIEFNITDMDNTTFNVTLYIDGVNISYGMDIENNTNTALSPPTRPPNGNHTFQITAFDGLVADYSAIYTIVVDSILFIDVITENNTIFSTSTPTIEFNIRDLDSETVEVTLYIDDNDVLYNSSVPNGTNIEFISPIDLANGNHTFQLEASDGVTSNSSDVYTMTIDAMLVANLITLNGTVFDTATPTIEFSVIDADDEIVSAILYIDGGIVYSNSSVPNNTIIEFTTSGLLNGEHTFQLEADDGLNTEYSDERTMIINASCLDLEAFGYDEYSMTESTVLCEKEYYMSDDGNGVLIFDSNNIDLDCGGATLIGEDSGIGIYSYLNDNISIHDCNIENYESGIEITGPSEGVSAGGICSDNPDWIPGVISLCEIGQEFCYSTGGCVLEGTCPSCAELTDEQCESWNVEGYPIEDLYCLYEELPGELVGARVYDNRVSNNTGVGLNLLEARNIDIYDNYFVSNLNGIEITSIPEGGDFCSDNPAWIPDFLGGCFLIGEEYCCPLLECVPTGTCLSCSELSYDQCSSLWGYDMVNPVCLFDAGAVGGDIGDVNVSIWDNYISENYEFGIKLLGAKYIEIYDNRIENNVEEGILFYRLLADDSGIAFDILDFVEEDDINYFGNWWGTETVSVYDGTDPASVVGLTSLQVECTENNSGTWFPNNPDPWGWGFNELYGDYLDMTGKTVSFYYAVKNGTMPNSDLVVYFESEDEFGEFGGAYYIIENVTETDEMIRIDIPIENFIEENYYEWTSGVFDKTRTQYIVIFANNDTDMTFYIDGLFFNRTSEYDYSYGISDFIEDDISYFGQWWDSENISVYSGTDPMPAVGSNSVRIDLSENNTGTYFPYDPDGYGFNELYGSNFEDHLDMTDRTVSFYYAVRGGIAPVSGLVIYLGNMFTGNAYYIIENVTETDEMIRIDIPIEDFIAEPYYEWDSSDFDETAVKYIAFFANNDTDMTLFIDGLNFVKYPDNSTTNNIYGYNTISGSDTGIKIIGGVNETIYSNYIENNLLGLNITMGSINNLIYNNKFSNTINAYSDAFNFWNITMTPGRNILGGSYIGGNYWSDYEGFDTTFDTFGDTLLPYTTGMLSGGDYLPLASIMERVSEFISRVFGLGTVETQPLPVEPIVETPSRIIPSIVLPQEVSSALVVIRNRILELPPEISFTGLVILTIIAIYAYAKGPDAFKKKTLHKKIKK